MSDKKPDLEEALRAEMDDEYQDWPIVGWVAFVVQASPDGRELLSTKPLRAPGQWYPQTIGLAHMLVNELEHGGASK